MKSTRKYVMKAAHLLKGLEEMISRRMKNTGENLDTATKHIRDYLLDDDPLVAACIALVGKHMAKQEANQV